MNTIWDDYYKQPLEQIPWHQTQADWFVELIEAGKVSGESALDIGCGVGAKSVFLAQHDFKEVVGIDVAPQAVRYAKEAASKAGVTKQCTFYTHDASDLSFLPAGKQFDLILDWAMLHCLSHEQIKTYPTEVAARLRSDGQFLLRVFSPNNSDQHTFTEAIANETGTVYMYTESDIQSLFQNFKIIERNTSLPRTKNNAHFLELFMTKEPSSYNE